MIRFFLLGILKKAYLQKIPKEMNMSAVKKRVCAAAKHKTNLMCPKLILVLAKQL